MDADACPVTDLIWAWARDRQLPLTLVCDNAHQISREGARTITVDRGADSADFVLVNLLAPGDLVITQDYGLAAMCLGRGARVLDQDGREYTADNIDSLLMARHLARAHRRAGGRSRGPAKRRPEQDAAFAQGLEGLVTPHG